MLLVTDAQWIIEQLQSSALQLGPESVGIGNVIFIPSINR